MQAAVNVFFTFLQSPRTRRYCDFTIALYYGEDHSAGDKRQGGQYPPLNNVRGGRYSLENSVRGGGQYSPVNNVRGDRGGPATL